ncbi:NAD-dependent epimerase/dehydratase family protein, partial [Dubosiella newyorkensis]|uniref:NAD-dependent epimerase/dehydratase family protein n=1 Tax=Dubosiella newyorkensis TaxID=1862672 RepID=UPI0034E3FAB9
MRKFMKKQKAIITGGTGMIGIALIRCLLTNDIDVTVIVNPNSNRQSVLNQFNTIKIVQK